MRSWGLLSAIVLVGSMAVAQGTRGGAAPVAGTGVARGAQAGGGAAGTSISAPGVTGAGPAPVGTGTAPSTLATPGNAVNPQVAVPVPGGGSQLQQAMPGPTPTGTSQLQQALPAPGTPAGSPAPGLNTQTPSAGGFVISTPATSLNANTGSTGTGGTGGGQGAGFLRTPVMSLDPQAFSPAGATAATGTLLPGATNATLANHPGDPSNTADTRARARLPFNAGAASFSSVYDVSAPTEVRSLGEVAAEFRSHRNQVARVITNQDVERVNQQPGVSMGGTSGAAMNAGTGAAPSGDVSTNAVGQQGTTAGAPRSETAVEIAQATAPPPPDQAAEQSAGSELPDTASPLPLVALLGLLAGAASILCRK